MKKFIFLEFIPGAAGNFLTRCLNMLHHAYTWVDVADPTVLPTTIEEKLKLFNYQSVIDFKAKNRNWIVDFEDKLTDYTSHRAHWNIPDNSIAIMWSHPEECKFTNCYTMFVGQSDKGFRFCIDPTDNFEWCLINAHYKNSFISLENLECGKRLLLNPDVYKINLKKIVDGYDSFFSEFGRVCNIIGHELQDDEILAIKLLYNQWKETTLDYKNFDAYKKQIDKNYLSNILQNLDKPCTITNKENYT
jgi:hypothetical protein